jgi:DNA (cytosine-5)-methyltransferase 1
LTSAAGTSKRPLVAVDLFCGAGGLSYAFHRAGFQVAAAVEKDKHAAASYEASFVKHSSPDTKLLTNDIRDPEVIAALAALADPVDIVIGGPPCQDFSPARLKLRRKGRRATLVEHYFAILELLGPRAFLFENVPGLRTAAKGRYWRGVRQHAARLGYEVHSEVLHAEEFGVPQRRHRLFVVGLKKELGAFAFPRASGKAPKTVGETIGHLPEVAAGQVWKKDPMHRARQHREDTVAYLATIGQGQAWRQGDRTIPCHKDHDGHYDVYGRMRSDKVAPTITGGCTNPSKGRFIHPTQHRGLTLREAALLQTFPKYWRFFGGIEAGSLQVGNAVPVRLGRVLATALKKELLGGDQRGPCHGSR